MVSHYQRAVSVDKVPKWAQKITDIVDMLMAPDSLEAPSTVKPAKMSRRKPKADITPESISASSSNSMMKKPAANLKPPPAKKAKSVAPARVDDESASPSATSVVAKAEPIAAPTSPATVSPATAPATASLATVSKATATATTASGRQEYYGVMAPRIQLPTEPKPPPPHASALPMTAIHEPAHFDFLFGSFDTMAELGELGVNHTELAKACALFSPAEHIDLLSIANMNPAEAELSRDRDPSPSADDLEARLFTSIASGSSSSADNPLPMHAELNAAAAKADAPSAGLPTVAKCGFDPRRGAFADMTDGMRAWSQILEARENNIVATFNVWGTDMQAVVEGLRAENLAAAQASLQPKYNPNAQQQKARPQHFKGVFLPVRKLKSQQGLPSAAALSMFQTPCISH